MMRGGTLHLLDLETGESLSERRLSWRGMHGDSNTYPVAWSGDGRSIAAATEDYSITIFDAADLSERRVLDAHDDKVRSLAFVPDGSLLSGSDDGRARVWDIETGQCLATLEHGRAVLGVSVRPDGSRIATGTEGTTVRVWDARTLKETARLEQHEWYVKSLAWSPDGQTLFTASGDGTIGIWDPSTGLDRDLARRERRRLVAELKPRLPELVGDAEDYDAARARVIANKDLSARERQVVLQLHVAAGWARKAREEAAGSDG